MTCRGSAFGNACRRKHPRVQFGVPGLIHLSHPAFTDSCGDLVDAEAGAGSEGHGRFRKSLDYIGRAAGRGQGGAQVGRRGVGEALLIPLAMLWWLVRRFERAVFA